MSDAIKTVFQEFADQIVSDLKAQGIEAKHSLEEIAAYTSERAAHQSASVGQPGFAEAAGAEAMNVALFAAEEALERSDSIDTKTREWWTGAFMLVARLAAVAI